MAKISRKVVAHMLGGKLIKGYLNGAHSPDLDVALREHVVNNGAHLPIQAHDSGDHLTVGLEGLKALFFVKTFEGKLDYNEVKFFESHPAVEGLWVQVR